MAANDNPDDSRDPETGAQQPTGDAPSAGSEQPAGNAEQALRALEQRLGRASEAAERLIAEAAGAAARGIGNVAGDPADEGPADHQPPAAGWAAPDSSAGRGGPIPDGDVDTLVQLVRSLRDLIPPDLQRRLGEAVRELLLAVRALIDWYLERIEQRRAAPAEVQDIPIL